MKRLLLFCLLVAATALAISSRDTLADIASRLCPGPLYGCLTTDGTNLCVDTDRDGVPCENGEPNLTLNAPTSAAGDETVQGDLTVALDTTVTGDLTLSGRGSDTGFPMLTGGGVNSAFGLDSYSTTSCITMNNGVDTCTNESAKVKAVMGIHPGQVYVRDFTCAWTISVAMDASDSISFCLEELGSTDACVTGSTLQFTNSDANGTVKTAAVNTTTTNTSNLGLSIGIPAKNQAGGNAERFQFNCWVQISYE